MDTNLKPCPFCGGAATLRVDSDLNVILECNGACPWVSISESASEEEMRAAWNTRADDREAIAAAESAARRRIIGVLFDFWQRTGRGKLYWDDIQELLKQGGEL